MPATSFTSATAATAAPRADWRTYLRERGGDGALAGAPAWLEMLERLYGYRIVPLTVTNAAGEISGVLPLCLLSSPLIGRRLVAVPFADRAPLLADDETSAQTLVEQAIALARSARVRYLELRTGESPLLAGREDCATSDLYVRWLIPLAAGPDAVWKAVHKPVQRQIKKAQKTAVSVRLAEQRADVLAYHRVHLLTRTRKHGMPAQPARFFLELWDTYAASGALRVLLAEHEGATIAGMVLLGAGDTLRYAYGASDPTALAAAPNNLLMWEAIQLGCRLGYQTLDLGRTARDNEGLMQFKRGWGATPESLTYYYFPRRDGLASTAEHSWKYRLATGCWRRLPLPLADALSDRLYKHLG